MGTICIPLAKNRERKSGDASWGPCRQVVFHESVMLPAKINLPKVEDSRGNLSFAETGMHIPFDVKRAYWVGGIPNDQKSEGLAFHVSQEVIFALAGSFDVRSNDGNVERTFSLSCPSDAVYVPEMCWRSLENFSENSLAFVLTSTEYAATDCIRDFAKFLELKRVD